MVSEGSARSPVSLRALWFGLLGGPVAWTLQLLIDYPLVAHYCFPDAAPRTVPTIDSLRLLILVTSAIAIAVAVLALVTALRSWRASGGALDDARTDSTDESPPVGRVRFMALGGILASGLTIVGIVLHGGFILLMSPCR
jgi:hypothetical protein